MPRRVPLGIGSYPLPAERTGILPALVRTLPFPARAPASLLALPVALLLALLGGCAGQEGNAGTPGEAAGSEGGVGAGPGGDGPVFQSRDHAYRVVTVVSGLAHPWGMTFLPDGGILVTERPGRLRLVRDGVLHPDPVAGTPEVWARGQGGLLDVALHPDFDSNGLVYLTYSKPVTGGATTALFRARYDAAGHRLVEGQDLFVADAATGAGQHFGSRLAFDGAGHLFMTVGDRGEMREAQNPRNHQGTTLRLTLEGGVPGDNPFAGSTTHRPEIWTWGNRNAQGLVIHPETGELWATEHGPQGGDELNLLLPGRNYGWPEATYGRNYGTGTRISPHEELPGMEGPVHVWTPALAPSGLAVYTGDRFPRWQGSLLAGGLAGNRVARLTLEGHRVVDEETLLREFRQRIRDVRVGPDGYVYLLVDTPSAPMVRLEPAG